ncbi:hypothetical protein BJX99DRAFT_174253 [Aspergillus californicus]
MISQDSSNSYVSVKLEVIAIDERNRFERDTRGLLWWCGALIGGGVQADDASSALLAWKKQKNYSSLPLFSSPVLVLLLLLLFVATILITRHNLFLLRFCLSLVSLWSSRLLSVSVSVSESVQAGQRLFLAAVASGIQHYSTGR